MGTTMAMATLHGITPMGFTVTSRRYTPAITTIVTRPGTRTAVTARLTAVVTADIATMMATGIVVWSGMARGTRKSPLAQG